MNFFNRLFAGSAQPVPHIAPAIVTPLSVPVVDNDVASRVSSLLRQEAAVHEGHAAKAKLAGKHADLVIHSTVAERLRALATRVDDEF